MSPRPNLMAVFQNGPLANSVHRALPDLSLGIVSGRLVSTRLLTGPLAAACPGISFYSLYRTGSSAADKWEVGRSQSADRRSKAKTIVKKGEGDRGDRRSG